MNYGIFGNVESMGLYSSAFVETITSFKNMVFYSFGLVVLIIAVIFLLMSIMGNPYYRGKRVVICVILFVVSFVLIGIGS